MAIHFKAHLAQYCIAGFFTDIYLCNFHEFQLVAKYFYGIFALFADLYFRELLTAVYMCVRRMQKEYFLPNSQLLTIHKNVGLQKTAILICHLQGSSKHH